MARKAYITRKRREANADYAALVGPATPPAPAPLPELLARAVALVAVNPAQASWEDCESVLLDGTGFRLRRLYRAGVIPSGNFDVIVLYNPDRNIPAFPVATLVGTQYRAMTDVKSFEQWLKLQGVTR